MIIRKAEIIGLLSLCVLGVVGCAASYQEELRQWMDQERRSVVPKVTPISEPKQFVAAKYKESDAADPFNMSRLTVALQKDKAQNAGALLIAAEEKRAKEPLENYPLDTIVMVGSWTRWTIFFIRLFQGIILVRIMGRSWLLMKVRLLCVKLSRILWANG